MRSFPSISLTRPIISYRCQASINLSPNKYIYLYSNTIAKSYRVYSHVQSEAITEESRKKNRKNQAIRCRRKKIPLVCTFLLARGLPVYRLFHSTVDYRVGHNSPCIAAPTGTRLSRAKFRGLSSTFTFPRVSFAITFQGTYANARDVGSRRSPVTYGASTFES